MSQPPWGTSDESDGEPSPWGGGRPAQPEQPAWGSQQPPAEPQQPPAEPQQPAWGQQPAQPQGQPQWPGQQPAQPQWPGQPQGQPAGQPQWPGQPQGQPAGQPQWAGQPQGQPQFEQPGQPGGAPFGPPGGAPQKKRRTGLIIGLIVGLLVIGGGAFAAITFLSGSSDSLITRVPSESILYAHVNLDPSPGNKLGVSSLFDRINAAAGENVFDMVTDQMDDDGIDFATEVDPWLGDQIAAFLLEIPDLAAAADSGQTPDVSFAALLGVEDEALATQFVTSQGTEGPWNAGEGLPQGFVLATGADGTPEGVLLIDDGIMYIGSESGVRAAVTTDTSLDDNASFQQVDAALPDGVMTLYVDPQRILDALQTLPGAALPSDLPGFGAGDDPGLFGSRISFTEGAVDITSVTIAPDGTAVAAPVAPARIEDLPGGGLFYFRAQITQGFFDGFLSGVDMGAEGLGGPPPSEQIDQALQQTLGTSLTEIASWLGDVTFLLDYDGTAASDNFFVQLQASVTDPTAAAALVDGLVAQVPPEAITELGATVGPGSVGLGDVSLVAADSTLTLAAGTPGEGTLGDSEVFRQAREGLEGEALLFVDFRGILDAFAPVLAGGGLAESEVQGLNVAAAFDSMVATSRVDGNVSTGTLRITFRSQLTPLDLTPREPNLPDLDLGPAGTLADLLAGGGGMQEIIGGPPPAGAIQGGTADAFGDDPVLDELFVACGAGDFTACDTLFLQSPLGSQYEDFGRTCGGRTTVPVLSCASEFGQ